MGDFSGASVRWQLDYSQLADSECASIQQLFEAAEGRLQPFTFLDPAGNLLLWSEDWSKPVWTADPLLQVAPGMQDPLGGNSAVQLTNGAQTFQRVLQLIDGPSWFRYCFSVYLRCDVSTTVHLIASAAGQEIWTACAIGSAWTRWMTAAKLSVEQDGVSFGVQLPAGSRIEAFGAQVEAQPAAGIYKRTTDHAGVYRKTRFASDVIAVTASSLNQNSVSVQLISSLSES
jgi:hypothetical protein